MILEVLNQGIVNHIGEFWLIPNLEQPVHIPQTPLPTVFVVIAMGPKPKAQVCWVLRWKFLKHTLDDLGQLQQGQVSPESPWVEKHNGLLGLVDWQDSIVGIPLIESPHWPDHERYLVHLATGDVRCQRSPVVLPEEGVRWVWLWILPLSGLVWYQTGDENSPSWSMQVVDRPQYFTALARDTTVLLA